MADFGTMLRLLRKERGLSQQELADALKISKVPSVCTSAENELLKS